MAGFIMVKPEKHGHAPAGGFWKPPEGAATVSPRPAGGLSGPARPLSRGRGPRRDRDAAAQAGPGGGGA